jgi:hypothetical protein
VPCDWLAVLSGDDECDREKISHLTAIQADAGETLELSAASTSLELFLIGLPPVVLPPAESQEYDLEEIPAEDREPVGQSS